MSRYWFSSSLHFTMSRQIRAEERSTRVSWWFVTTLQINRQEKQKSGGEMTSEVGCCHLVVPIMLFPQKSSHKICTFFGHFYFTAYIFVSVTLTLLRHSRNTFYLSFTDIWLLLISALPSICAVWDHPPWSPAQHRLQTLPVWPADILLPGTTEGPCQPRYAHRHFTTTCHQAQITNMKGFLNIHVHHHWPLITPGHHDEALAVAERGRTRAFADLLVERQTGQQDSDPYTPVTVEHILDTVNSQRALVLYFSMAAGYLYSWLLAPGAGKHWTYCKSFCLVAEIVSWFHVLCV